MKQSFEVQVSWNLRPIAIPQDSSNKYNSSRREQSLSLVPTLKTTHKKLRVGWYLCTRCYHSCYIPLLTEKFHLRSKGKTKGKVSCKPKTTQDSLQPMEENTKQHRENSISMQKTLNPVPCNMELANISFFCFTATRLHMKCSHPTSQKHYL